MQMYPREELAEALLDVPFSSAVIEAIKDRESLRHDAAFLAFSAFTSSSCGVIAQLSHHGQRKMIEQP